MGRSAYLCRNRACLQQAQAKNRLKQALRTPVPPEVFERLWARLAEDSSAVDSRARTGSQAASGHLPS
jgi:predicted RNA-binding protein YlxR (DUF448 family)